MIIPASLKCEEINPAIIEYIRGNIDDLTKKTKKAVEDYREKWHDMLDTLYGECSLQNIMLSRLPELRIAKTRDLFSIKPECHGIITEIKCSLDPALSLMSDESVARLIKPAFMRAAAELFDITQGPMRVKSGVFSDDLSSVEFKSEDYYENPVSVYHAHQANELRNNSYSADYDVVYDDKLYGEIKNILGMNMLSYNDRRST